jgi:hypothetical protein
MTTVILSTSELAIILSRPDTAETFAHNLANATGRAHYTYRKYPGHYIVTDRIPGDCTFAICEPNTVSLPNHNNNQPTVSLPNQRE